RSDLDARDTGTAADEALQAIVVAEVEHAVDHEAERVGVAVQGIGTRVKRTRPGRRTRDARSHEATTLDVGFTVTDFHFRAERAEIVADGTFEVVTLPVIESAGIVDGADIEIHVLDQHHATTHSYIPGVVARDCGRRKGSGGQRHGDGKLPHRNSPFN